MVIKKINKPKSFVGAETFATELQDLKLKNTKNAYQGPVVGLRSGTALVALALSSTSELKP